MTELSAYDRISKKMQRGDCVVLDGAIATELQALGARDFRLTDSDHWGFEALHHLPHLVSEVHRRYVAAGCDVLTTNTYGLLDVPASPGNPLSQGTRSLHWIDLARRSITLARQAHHEDDERPAPAVAFSIGGDVVTDDHLTTLKLLLRSIADQPPDLVLFETLSMMREHHTREAIAMFLDAGLPVWVSFRRCRDGVCGIHGQLWGGPEGDYFGRLAADLEELGVGALLINCLPANRVSGTLPWLGDFTDLPLGVYPNLGRYVDPAWQFDDETSPEDYADMALIWRAEGASILGGCCGVRPSHIEAMAKAVEGTQARAPIADAGARIASVAETPTPEVPAWTDSKDRRVFPLPLPRLQVDPGVFVPTQGSYLVWKYLFNHLVGAGRRCLDIGCGAGLLAVQLALNGASRVMAVDIDEAAVANTLTNAFRNDVADLVEGKVVDLYAFKPQQRYDVVVASLYQMPTDPMGELSGHRPVDYWGRNLLDHCISILPDVLSDDGTAYLMQISLLGQYETERQLRAAGFETRVVDYNLYEFTSVFTENLDQIERVVKASDAFKFDFRDSHVMVMYLVEARRTRG